MKRICKLCEKEWNDRFMRSLGRIFRSEPYDWFFCYECRNLPIEIFRMRARQKYEV